ncbi:hypothetical protein [uncultured Lacinutrix sp.]|uniref:hypothetical protein n=1 Tax=uncultured Lacinutrix sp. TaxID=574032 RepID=UPI002639A92E|nr:hypothetical protein [uncultured Lacinutrix sp.]
MAKIAIHIVFLLLPLAIWSQSYVGHIGKYPIHLQINTYVDDKDESKGKCDGYYFYDSKLINIPLSGVYNKEDVVLVDGYHYFEDSVESAGEVFTLKKKEDQLIGSIKLKEKTHKVVLNKTDKDPLETYRNQKLTFVKDSVSTYNDKQLVWFHEKWSKTQLFRLGNGFSKAQRAVFNPILDEIHLDDAKVMLECNSWFELSLVINLVNNNFVSFSKFYSVYCGGAHPSHGNNGYNFDLNKLTHVDAIETLYPNVDFFELLKKKYYDAEDIHQQDCEVFTQASNWEFKTWNLTSKGVMLTPSYPHAMTPCEDAYFLTYKELEKK